MSKTGFELAIERCGRQADVAKILGCSQQKISWSIRHSFPMTAEQALKLEEATRGTKQAVTRYELLPDVFGQSPVVAELIT